MKKRLFLLSTLLILTMLPGCSKDEQPANDTESQQTTE